MRVFVIDDDWGIRDSVSALLEANGYEVRAFETAGEFVCQTNAWDGPLVLLLDQHMPGQTGLEFLATEAARSRDLRVVMVTGAADTFVRRRAKELGVAQVLDKPTSQGSLVEALQRLC